MNADLTYRTGSMDDFKQLKELGLITFGQYSSLLKPEHWKTLHENLNNEEKLKELVAISKIVVCTHNDRIVGCAFLVPNGHPNPIFESGWAQIRMVGVHPDYTGQGIAKHLTRLCIEHARQTSEKIIALHTSEFMDAARHIYEKAGFKKIKEIDPLFGKRYWLYQLEL